MHRIFFILCVCMLLLPITVKAAEKAILGTLFGAGIGAVIGHSADRTGGAGKGAIIGAMGGYFIY